jgi:hypothetical protein
MDVSSAVLDVRTITKSSTTFTLPMEPGLETGPPAMSASQALQHLYSPDPSSPDFLRALYGFIRLDKEEQCSSSLQGPELARLVDFLDAVRPLSSAFRPLRNRLHRPSVLFPSPTTSSDNVYAKYKSSVAATLPCHPHTSYPVISSELVLTRSPGVASPMCMKELSAMGKSASRR